MKSLKLFLTLSILAALLWGAETEVVAKRTFTSNTYVSDNGQYKMVANSYPVNYLEGDRYLPIPDGEDRDYFTALAVSQMKEQLTMGKTGKSIFKSTINNSLISDPITRQYIYGTTTYLRATGTPYMIGKQYADSDDWLIARVYNYWACSNLESDYIVDSTIYEITFNSWTLDADSLQIQWRFLGWSGGGDYQTKYEDASDGPIRGTIVLTGNSTTTQSKRIKWITGSAICDSLQSMIEMGASSNGFYSGLTTDQERGTEDNYATASSQTLTIYYTPPKKSVFIDNCVYGTSTSIGGQLCIEGTLPGGTNVYNTAGNSVQLYIDTTYIISEPEDIIIYNNTNYVHHSWKENTNDFELNRDFTNDEYTTEEIGNFSSQKVATITLECDNSEAIAVKDPWWKDPATGQRHNPAVYHDLTGTSYSVFLNQNTGFNPEYPIYSLQAPEEQTIDGYSYWFQRWEGSNVDIPDPYESETEIVFQSENASVEAKIKGHMHTDSPGISNAINQRRVISGRNDDNVSVVVYEDIGDIWITVENVSYWMSEERLSVSDGAASDPTISNVFSFGTNCREWYMIAWEESGDIHLQTMQLSGGIFYGWGAYNDGQCSTNHKTLQDDFYLPAAKIGAHPSLNMYQSGNNVIMTFAYESNSGIIAGKLLFEGNGTNSIEDLSGASIIRVDGFSRYRLIGNSSSYCYPVIIYYPSVYGFSASERIYYLGFTGEYAGNRVYEYNWSTETSTLVSGASGDYCYYSLQGAPNPLGASIGLVAEALNNSLRKVNYYIKATYYGNGVPTLYSTFSSMSNPTIMVNNVSTFGYPSSEIYMQSTSNSSWYKSTGSTPSVFASNTSGFLTRTSVTSADHSAMAIRSASDPALIERYSGSGSLSKGVTTEVVDVKAVRIWNEGTKNEQIAILDFSDSEIEFIDSLETGNTICAVKYIQPSNEGAIVSQVDSMAKSLAVNVYRNGNCIRSYTPSKWISLGTKNIDNIQSGDVIYFNHTSSIKDLRGYKEYTIRELAIEEPEPGKETQDLLELTTGISNYPNPFNAMTNFKVTLTQPERVKIVVFDLMGRQIKEIVNDKLSTGVYIYSFDGTNLASGIYYYRWQIGKNSSSGKILLLK